MFRPWSQDPRPIWRVEARWETSESVEAVGDELLRALMDTGQVRAPSLEAGDGGLAVTLLIRAEDEEAAAHAVARIADVACRLAGLGHLGSVSVGAVRPGLRESAGVRATQ
jgi:hypothetical protein